MTRLVRLPRVLFLSALMLAAVPPAAGQKGSSTSKKADPAGTGPVMGQLRALFTEWDDNKDNFLDKRELAKGFRDLQAKTVPASGKAAPPKKGPSLPDQQFVARVDQDGDGRVSRDEFLNWAREYAVLLKNIAASEGKIAKAEARLQTNLRATTRQTVETDLQTEKQNLEKLTAQLPPFDKHIQNVLKPQKESEEKKGKE